MLIFCIGRHFESHGLSTKVTLHLVSTQAIKSGLKSGEKCLGVKVTRAVTYIQPLNANLKSKDWYTILEAMIGMGKTA